MDGSQSHWTDDDDDLMGLVADALADVPPWVASAGRAAYTWRSIDVELAALQVPTKRADCDSRDLGDDEPTAPSATATHKPLRGFPRPRPEARLRHR